MGGGGVGKSALTVRFVHQMFVEKYDPTIEDSYRRNLTVDGINVALEVLDTAGTEQFMSLSTLYMRSGDGFLLVFSLTSMESVQELHSIREQIQRIKEASALPGQQQQRVPLVLVGNKLDLVSERQVPRDVAINLSRSWGGVPFYETSARKEINVTEIFEDVVRQCVKVDHAAGSARNRRSGGSGRREKRKCSIL
ncbi:Ras-related protein rsr1 [Rhodosporidiobolus nylandii]